MEKFKNTIEPDSLDEGLLGENANFKRSNIPPNEISSQIKAYSSHVEDESKKTGKSKEEIVKSEMDEIRRIGLANFVKNL